MVGARQWAHSKPAQFFRTHEIQGLFNSFELCSCKDIRNYALLHLAYGMGLRPNEISLISFDDISFTRSELTLTTRKNDRPVTLPFLKTP